MREEVRRDCRRSRRPEKGRVLKPFVLASRSPRRATLLKQAGYRFRVRAPRVDEQRRPGESAPDLAERLAREKALDVAGRLRPAEDLRVLAADTIVASGREILGKPRNRDDAARMLRLLSGRSHRVITGVALWSPGYRIQSECAITRVTFRRLTRDEVDWYVATGEADDKAGSYGIQGAGGLFVTRVQGSASNVVGLPMHLACRFLGLPR